MTTAAPSLFMSSRIVCRIVDAAVARGVDRTELCRTAGLSPGVVYDVDARIEFERYLRLWTAAVERVAEPGFPLAVAEDWNQTHNLLRFVCMSSEDLDAAFVRASRYLRVITNAVEWPLERGDQVTVLAMVRAASTEHPAIRYAEEFGAAEIVTLARAFTGAPWNPLEVRFTFREPDDIQRHRTFFRAPLTFGHHRCEVRLATESLRLPLLRADPPTVEFFGPLVERLIGTNPPPAPGRHSDEVRFTIANALNGSAPTVEQVAASLQTSGRTLRRHLQAEGCTFQQVLDEVRLEVAKRHIASRSMALAELSFLLGFSEPSAFHRAFRRWTGMTPQTYARLHRTAPP